MLILKKLAMQNYTLVRICQLLRIDMCIITFEKVCIMEDIFVESQTILVTNYIYSKTLFYDN